ncbi:MAG: SDR family NAD(P)-dependent oxidoreductase, partial [Acidimicrobiales bacterium]
MPDLRPPIPEIAELFRLDGCTAVVTGGASGIGRGAAHALGQAGADVVVVDLDAELAAKTAQEIGATSAGLDVTDEEGVKELFGDLARCDVLVTCAGRSLRAPSLETSMEDWQAVVDVN